MKQIVNNKGVNMKKYKYAIFLLFLVGILLKAQEVEIPEPPEPFFKMNEKTEQEYLKNANAELKQKLQAIKEINQQEYFELLNELQFSNMGHHYFSERDKNFQKMEQEIVEYEIETKSLIEKLKKEDGAEKAQIKSSLQKAIGKLFDLKEKRRSLEIKRLEERLDELNKKLKIRKQNKDEIIKRRMQELLGEENYLEWE